MSPLQWLVLYSVLILLASLAGGMVPIYLRLTHRRMEFVLSFVSGVILGIGMLHLLPHAWAERAEALAEAGIGASDAHAIVEPVVLWLLGGFLSMFLIERFFSFHQHPVDHEDHEHRDDGECDHHHHHAHSITWTGATIGLTLHSLLAGMALAGSMQAGGAEGAPAALAGLGMFLVIVLHKPFDAMAIGALMATGGRPRNARHLVNALFALAIPLGAGLFILGAGGEGAGQHEFTSAVLAFAAGMFMCIALSDLLPELQFHQHDRIKLSVALLLGLALAWGVARLEAGTHGDHDQVAPMMEISDSSG